ncbi:MAG: hypothetical protein AAF978_07010, partial [Cyanobacteria bacterium P01_E01_bin.48]
GELDVELVAVRDFSLNLVIGLHGYTSCLNSKRTMLLWSFCDFQASFWGAIAFLRSHYAASYPVRFNTCLLLCRWRN